MANIDATGWDDGVVPAPHVAARILVPYFTDTSVPAPHVGARIACTGFANQSFGDLTHETWKFGGDEHSRFGQAGVGHTDLVWREGDTRLPKHNSLVYGFDTAPSPRIYCFGLGTVWGAARASLAITPPATLTATFGVSSVGDAHPVPVVSSTRFPSTHLTIKYPFGYNPFPSPDTFVATLFGTAVMTHRIAGVEQVGSLGPLGEPMVTRFNPPALRLRDTKNTTLKFDGVPYQFGYPKRDVFPIGVKPAGFGRLRPTAGIQVAGFVDTKIWDWSAPWVQPIVQHVQWNFSYGYAGHPMSGAMGAVTVNNTGQHGIRPLGFVATGFSGTSVNNVDKSIHPYHGRLDVFGNVTDNMHSRLGTAAAAVDPAFIPPQRVYPDPFVEPFRDDGRVWYLEPRTLGPIGLGQTEAGEFVQCVLLDPDIYTMEGYATASCGVPHVKRQLTIRPASAVGAWGASQVTHYTRYLGQWQPWQEARFGEVGFQYRTHITASGIAPSNSFGDVHQWHENTIQLRPWGVPLVPSPGVVYVVRPAGLPEQAMPSPRVVVPLYANTFWATIMGHNPAVAFGDSTYCCGQSPRAVVPKGFPVTQFGDFDAQL